MVHNIYMDIGLRIKELRKERAISQDELAKAIGVGRTTVTRWETWKYYPSLDEVVSLSNYFSVSTDFLLGKQEY